MGGCASKPKDLDTGAAPPENPTSPKKLEAEVDATVVPQGTIMQENDNGGETKKEDPLVDISEPAKEEAKSKETSTESKTTAEETKPAEEAAKEEPKKEEEVPKKEDEKKTVSAAEVAAAATKVPEEKGTAPKTEDKSDAPLVTV